MMFDRSCRYVAARRACSATHAARNAAGSGFGGVARTAGSIARTSVDDVAGQLGVPCWTSVDGRADRAAALVAEDHDQRHGQVLDGVLDAADDGGVEHLAGRADDEQVAEALVEHQLR